MKPLDSMVGDNARLKFINVNVTPNSKAPKVLKVDEENYEVKVDERAAEGRANARLIEILSEYFGVTKSELKIVKGLKARSKVILIKKG